MFEQYAIINNYPNYAVSTYGGVINIKTGRMLKLKPNAAGYNCVKLYKNKTSNNFIVHNLISSSF